MAKHSLHLALFSGPFTKNTYLLVLLRHLFWTFKVYFSVCFFFIAFHQWHISKPLAFRPEIGRCVCLDPKDTQETRGVGVKDSSKKMGAIRLFREH